MATFVPVHEREWLREDLVGNTVERCRMWYGGEGVSASLVKMPPDHRLGRHRHETWVTVFVVDGALLVQSADGDERKMGAGDFYFVPPDDEHTETSLEESTILIIKAEPNVQYAIDEDGNRISEQ